jgi:hypothetical protein
LVEGKPFSTDAHPKAKQRPAAREPLEHSRVAQSTN